MGVCEPWATVDDLTGVCAPESGDDTTELEAALQVASDVVYTLSGRQFPGVCDDVLHPTRASCRWLTATRLRLGVAPIIDVSQVVIDGAVLDASAYRVDDSRVLVRLDGDPWPAQDLDDTDAFRVELTHGRPPPQAGVWAVAALACELAKSRDPDLAGDCKLPKRVTNVTRQGLSMVVLDPMDFLDDGKTGVYDVDLFLKAYNPARLQRRATVMSPDIGRRARRLDT